MIVDKQEIHGFPVVQVIDERRTTSLVSIVFRAGSRLDPKGQEGVAHFFEHLLMKQTARYDRPVDRMLALERLGISANAWTNVEEAGYCHTQRAEHTLTSLDHLLRDWRETVFSQGEFEKERGVILQELEDQLDDVSTRLSFAHGAALFGNHPFGRNSIGTQVSLQDITREDIEQFYRDYYQVFPVIGIMTPVKLDLSDILSKYTTGLKASSPLKTVMLPSIQKHELKISRKGGRGAITVGFRTPPITGDLKERTALNVLKNVVGNCWSSILIQKLREEQPLTYWVSANTLTGIDAGALTITALFAPDVLPQVREGITQGLEIVRNGAFHEGVFLAAKEIHLAAVAEEYTDAALLLNNQIFGTVVGQEPDAKEEYVRMAEAMTHEDVVAVAQRYLGEENMVVAQTDDALE